LCCCRNLTGRRLLKQEIGIAQKFIQENLSQAFARTAVTREQRPGHFLRKPQTKNRLCQIGKEGSKTLLYSGREIVHDICVNRYSNTISSSPDSTACPGDTRISLTLPSPAARTSFSIFMASTINTP